MSLPVILQLSPKDRFPTSATIARVTGAAVVLGILLRVVNLDADSQYYEWVGHITDEGRWVYQARGAVLFATLSRDAVYDLHLMLAPLYQALNGLSFEVLGVTRAASRLWTAAFGCALLVLFWRMMRPLVTPRALLAGVVLLAVQVDFVALSRVAVPEMAIVFVQAGVFFSLMRPGRTPRQMLVPGVLFFIGLGLKGTLALHLMVFAIVVAMLPSWRHWHGARWRAVFWFVAGSAGPLIVAASVVLVARSLTPAAEFNAGEQIRAVLTFIAPANLYHIIEFPFTNPLAPTINFMALGLWMAWLAADANPGLTRDHPVRRHLLASGVWVACYFAMMLMLAYFPQRYRVHIILPMVIAITCGFSLLELAQRGAITAVRPSPDRFADVRFALLMLPTAMVLAPALGLIVRLVGGDVESLRFRVICVSVSAALSLATAWRWRGVRRLRGFLFLFPVAAGSLWILASGLTGAWLPFWPTGHDAAADKLWLLLLLAVGMAAGGWSTLSEMGPSTTALTFAYVTSYAVMSLVQLSPIFLNPQYTVRDASRDLGVQLARVPRVASSRSEGLFLDNPIRFERFGHDMQSLPDVVVVAFEPFDAERQILDRDYYLVRSYSLHAPAEYFRVHPSAKPVKALLYRRRGALDKPQR